MSTAKERYREYLQSADWKQKRAQKRKRAKHCAICGAEKDLHVHHLVYRNWTDVTMSDLRVLCARCHRVAHELMDAKKIRFRREDATHRFVMTQRAVLREIGNEGLHWHEKTPRIKRPNGFTRAQLAEWGIPWPPPKGWKKQLDAQAAAFAPVWQRPQQGERR